MSLELAVPSAAPAPEAPVPGVDDLARLRDRIARGRQVLDLLGRVAGGPPLVADADKALAAADGVLATIGPLLAGRPDAAAVAETLRRAQAALADVDRAGLPGVLADGIATVQGALGSLGPAASTAAKVASVLGGPAGLVAAIVTGGMQFAADRARAAQWRRAVLALPPRFADLPDLPSGLDAMDAVDRVPGLRERLSTNGSLEPATATALLGAAWAADAGGELRPARAVALALLANPPFRDRFAGPDDLADAVDAVRTAMAAERAARALPPTLETGVAGAPPIGSLDLVRALAELRGDGHAAAEIERLVGLVGAVSDVVGTAGLDVPAILSAALDRAVAIAAGERQIVRGDPVLPPPPVSP